MNSRRRAVVMGCGLLAARHLCAEGADRPKRLGILMEADAAFFAPTLRIMRSTLRELGAQEGRDYVLETRYANGQVQEVPRLAAELAARQVAVILTIGPAAVPTLAATTGLPVVANGLRDNHLAQATAIGQRHRLTGVNMMVDELNIKRLELLAQCLPKGATVFHLNHPRQQGLPATQDLLDAGRRLGLHTPMAFAETPAQIEAALAEARRMGAQAVHQMGNQVLYAHRALIIERATAARQLTMLEWPEAVHDGGMLGYGVDRSKLFDRLTRLAWRVAQGEKPSALPIEQPLHITLAINLRTARTIGLKLPADLLARAEELVE